MKSRFIATVLMCLATVVWTHSALAQCILNVPPILTTANPPVSLLVCPAGDGDPLSQAWQNGVQVNATIEVQLLDGNGVPIANFPFEDIWMKISGLCECVGSGGFIASTGTDANGIATFESALSGGGYAANPVIEVWVNGLGLCATSVPLTIIFKSVDFDCNGKVNQADVNIMKGPHAIGDFSADLNNSGTEAPTTADAIVMAKHRFPNPDGHICP